MKIGSLVKVPNGARVRRLKDADDMNLSLLDIDQVKQDIIGLVLEEEVTTFSNKFYRILLPNDTLVWILGTDLRTIQHDT